LLLSRRQFLQLTGIAVLGSAIGLPEMPALSAAFGRTLQAVPVRQHPQHTAPITQHLWPDTVLPITPLPGAWYQTSEGYVEKAHIQPIMSDITYTLTAIQAPFWAEVSAPVAAIREWCAADAPLITRVGHGGVMHIIDQLPGDPMWYGVANEWGSLLGWTQAPGWQPVMLSHPNTALDIQLDQRNQQIVVSSAGKPLVRAGISTEHSLKSDSYPITRSDALATRQGDYYGAPWPLQFGGEGLIQGVYWHNQFGTPAPGAAVQIPVYLARWLYNTAANDSRLTIF
jgi:hypothetical protein